MFYLIIACILLLIYFIVSLPRVRNCRIFERQIVLLQADVSRKTKEADALTQSLNEVQHNCILLQDQQRVLQAKYDELAVSLPPEDSIVLSKDKYNLFNSAYNGWAAQSHAYQDSIGQISREMDTLILENEALKKTVTQSESCQQELARLSQEKDALLCEIEELKRRCTTQTENSSELSSLIKENTTLNMDNFKLKLRLSNLEDELAELNAAQNKKTENKKATEKDTLASDENKKQLDFLLKSFPDLTDFLASEYQQQPEKASSTEHDPVKDWLSDDEFHLLSETERNQLALDRYIESHKKSNWQIGRDYELSVGYQYELQGFQVEYTGSVKGMTDLGCDLIATRNGKMYIIQCKYWGGGSVIREKYIAQLFGTAEYYRQDHRGYEIIPLFVTSATLSKVAKDFAQKLGVQCRENFPLKDFPRVKCNVGKDKFGNQTFIYHLPMDAQYDSVKTDKERECRTFTVQEAESYGFRRAKH